jgi:Fur family ferric uptake transcriptional regulator
MRRNTRQRQVILEELTKLHDHPTAAELYEVVRQRLPRISLGTVYRNLELLASDGTIRKLEIGGAPSRFDGNTMPHCHVRCVRCGRVDDIPATAAELHAPNLKDLSGYEILGYRLEFNGICPACAATPKHEDTSGRNEAETREGP